MWEWFKENQERVIQVLGFGLIFLLGFSFGKNFALNQGLEPIIINEPQAVEEEGSGPVEEAQKEDTAVTPEVKGEEQAAVSSVSGPFVASKNSNKYHLPDDPHAKKIKPENLITFQTEEEARQAGYEPCSLLEKAAGR